MAGLVGRADVGPEPLLAAAAAPADTVMDLADTSSTASLAEAAAPAANTDVAISDSFLAKVDGVPPADVQVLDNDSVLDNGGDLLSASNFPLRARRKRIFTELEPGLGGPVAKRSRKPSTAPGAQKATVRKKSSSKSSKKNSGKHDKEKKKRREERRRRRAERAKRRAARLRDRKKNAAVQEREKKRLIKLYKQFSLWDNVYADRKRHRADKDVSVCMCRSIPGFAGCGESCMNRIGHVECLQGKCALGDNCSNQAMQRGEWKKVQLVNAGERGMGLRVLEDAKPGDFIIEYCGEVISLATCHDRQRAMIEKGENDVYFLATGPDEMIDARRKGSLARFINHSCNPNCKTQKWTVGNETKIGIFAIDYIPTGTELTFDYQFERFGAQSQQCFCGEANCRGILGAKGDAEVRRLMQEKTIGPSKVAGDSASDRQRQMTELLQARVTGRMDHLAIAQRVWEEKLLPSNMINRRSLAASPSLRIPTPFLKRNQAAGWRVRHAFLASHIALRKSAWSSN